MARLVTAAARRLDAMAVQADLDLSSAQMWRGLGAVFLAGAGFGVLQAGAIGAPVGGFVLAAAVLLALRANRHRRDQRMESQLPGFLEAVARGLRTGLQLGPAAAEAAVGTPPPLGDEVMLLADELGRGVRAADAFERWARRRPGSGTGLAAAAMAFAATAGGARARAIDGVAATLRDRAAMELEVRSLTSQARASAVMIAALPAGFMLVSAGLGEHSAAFLFSTRLGLAILGTGLALDAAGALWMRRIVMARD